MVKVLVLYYSSYGHIETMVNAIAEGARAAGAEVGIKRVPELVPEEVARNSHYKLDQTAPIAKPNDRVEYDAIIVGTGTRYGRMSSQMANFWDQTGGLWVKGALVGKVGAAFASTATQHGGQKTTLFSIITNLLHVGWWWSGSRIRSRARCGWMKSLAAHPTEPPLSPGVTDHVRLARTNWKAPVSSAAM